MNRRRLFAFLPAIPVAGISAIANANEKPLDLPLPKKGDYDWGQTLNNAILALQEEINKIKRLK